MADGSSRVAGSASLGLLTLPNAITFARLCAVPLAVWLVLRHDLGTVFWLFLGAGATDAVDGWLARHGRASAFGAVLDPMADKVLLVSMYVTLAAIDVLPDWIAILVVFRDLLIVGGVLLLFVAGQPVAICPLFISKVNTALQIMLVAASLLFVAIGIPVRPVLVPLLWLVAASTLASGAAYVRRAAWLR
ncbi:MAG: CDP-alcohol phosphatidyltransferase family protein [Rhodospirillales bacterium]|nr:CDP-alcohol phosphatidyltransferase family protein [Rhodospirillales bacterium]